MDEIINSISKVDRSNRSRGVSFGDVLYKVGGTCGPRNQADFQLVVLHEGSATITIDSKKFELPLRSVALLKPHHREFFQFSERTPTKHTWCAINPKMLSRSIQARLKKTPFCLPLSEVMESLITLGLSVPLGEGQSFLDLIDSLAMAALCEYVRVAEHLQGTIPRPPTPVEQARRFLSKSYAENLDLSAIARAASVSPHHLVRLFRRHLNTTPLRELWHIRTDRGVELLQGTGITIAEIAYRVGFQTPFHFSRWVKKRYGVSPRDYRERSWNTGRAPTK